MTLQSLSHSSNGSLPASYPFGGVARSHARRDASAASRGFAAYSRVLWRLPLFAVNGELASRLFKEVSQRWSWSQGEFRPYKNILSLTCKYPGLIALQELYGLVWQTSKYEQIASANELAESVCQGVIEIVISRHYARVRKGYGSNNGRS